MTLSPAELAAYRDEKRVLLVFAPSVEDERYVAQERELGTRQTDLSDRDMSVFYLLPPGAAPLYERFGVAENSFAVVLVGKDGTEKKRYDAPVSPDDLFATVDQMPMRRREMQGEA